MDETELTPQDKLLTRLHRIEGQVRGLQRMLEEGRPCEELLVQLSAVIAGLRKVGGMTYAAEVRRLLTAGEDDPERAALLERLADRFAQFS